jgi:hypothetical protein
MRDKVKPPKVAFSREREERFGIAGTTASPVYFYVCAAAGRDSVGWRRARKQGDILKDLSTTRLSSFS